MGKGSNTTTTNSTSSGTSSATPDANAYAAYQALLNRASGVASTPYQGYTGQEVAPINAQQTAGIGTINNTVANNHPLTAADIQQYQSPYTQDVINATQAQFNNQNAQQQSQVVGNAAAQGALGGDRVGVAQALTAQQQQLAQAPVIAGLQNAGYQQALQAAQQQQQFGFTSGLQGANAQIGAGTLQQQTQQAQDTQNRQDYYQKQGYPFQVAQWLAAIDTGVGSQMGGTSNSTNTGVGTTEGPTPNMFTQLAGLGLAGAALWPKARGGGVTGRRQGLAGGGVPTPYGDQFQGWVPTAAGITGGRGAPQAPSANLITPAAPKAQSIGLDATQLKGLGAIGKGITNSSFGDSMSDYMQDLQAGDAGSIGSYFARGGRIGYAEGGAPGDDYNTPLNGADEQAFQAWKMLKAPRDSGYDYDMRGAFKAGLSPAANGHWVDTFKKPNHETFSDESQYATGANRDRAGFWTGPNHDIFVPHAPMQRGGRVRRYASGGVARGYEDGGAPEDDVSFDDRFGAAFPHRMTAGIGASVPAFNDRYGHEDDFFNVPTPEQGLRMQEKGFELKGEPVINAGEAPFELNPTGTRASLDQAAQDNGPKIAAAARSAGLAPPVAAQNDNGLPPLIRAGVSRPPAAPDEESSTALGYDSSPGMRRGLAPPASTPTPSSDEGEGGLSGLLGKVGIHVTPEMRQGLLQAGLAMMATTRGGPGSFLGGLGEGGLRGAAAYGQATEQTRKDALEQFKLQNQLTQQELQNAQSPLIRGPNGQMIANPAYLAEKEEEAKLKQKYERDFRPQMIHRTNPETGEEEFYSYDPNTQKVTPLAGAGQQAQPAQHTYVPGQPLDYARDAAVIPHINKGDTIPDPKPIPGYSSDAIKEDAEKYLKDGELPKASVSPRNPMGMQSVQYQRTIRNYGVALALSRGLTLDDLADVRQYGPKAKAFPLSRQGDQTVAIGTAIRHIGALEEYAKAWDEAKGNINAPVLRQAAAKFASMLGRAEPANLEQAASIAGPEIIKAIGVAGGGTGGEREAQERFFQPMRATDQILGAANVAKTFLAGQLPAKEAQAEAIHFPHEKFMKMVGPTEYDYLSAINHGGKPATGGAKSPATDQSHPANAVGTRKKANGENWYVDKDGNPISKVP